MHWLYSTDSDVAQSNHANSEGTIQMFKQESKVKQKPEGATGSTVAAGGLCTITASPVLKTAQFSKKR